MTEVDTWNIISAFAMTITAICAAISIFLTYNIRKKDLESNRPYFMIKDTSGIELIKNKEPFIKIVSENIGKRPAANFESRIIIIDEKFKSEPLFNIYLSSGTEIPQNDRTQWNSSIKGIGNDVLPQFVINAIKYDDPVLKIPFTQIFYYRWGGVKKGVTKAGLTHIRKEQKNEIINFLRENEMLQDGFSWC